MKHQEVMTVDDEKCHGSDSVAIHHQERAVNQSFRCAFSMKAQPWYDSLRMTAMLRLASWFRRPMNMK